MCERPVLTCLVGVMINCVYIFVSLPPVMLSQLQQELNYRFLSNGGKPQPEQTLPEQVQLTNTLTELCMAIFVQACLAIRVIYM